MKILLFGGTTEGRLLAERLVGMGHQVTVSVATELGAEILQGQFCGPVLTGRMDLEAMAKLLPSYDLCVDATHPYAVKVTKQLQAACAVCFGKRVGRRAVWWWTAVPRQHRSCKNSGAMCS